MKVAVLGGGGFIGHHLVKCLKNEGHWVLGVDQKVPTYESTAANEFIVGDLREQDFCRNVLNDDFDEVYQLAADMGGAGYIFSGDNDSSVMCNSAIININVINQFKQRPPKAIFYSSSACIYPEHNQLDPSNPITCEESAYPAAPDSEYGWEKLFSERLYLAALRNNGLNCKVARYHNIFGPLGAWNNGKEKSPAAICRKVAEASNGGTVEVWGDGNQTRSFLYVDDCLDGTIRLQRSSLSGPYNIGSSQSVTINQLVGIVADIAGKSITINHIDGPLGVRGRKSDNKLILDQLKWQPSQDLVKGLENTYEWIEKNVRSGLGDYK